MACLKVKGPAGIRLLPESADGNVHGMQKGEVIVEAVWDCGPQMLGDNALDLESVITSDGFMVGNAIKKVTRALGFNHCMACTGRQIRYNEKGLEIQQAIKKLVTR